MGAYIGSVIGKLGGSYLDEREAQAEKRRREMEEAQATGERRSQFNRLLSADQFQRDKYATEQSEALRERQQKEADRKEFPARFKAAQAGDQEAMGWVLERYPQMASALTRPDPAPRNPIIGSEEWRAAERFKASLIPRDDKTLVAVVGPDGKSPVLVPRSQAAGMVPWEKQSGSGGRLGTGNVEQSKSLGFARRMIAADKILRAKENTGKPTVGVQALKSTPIIGDAAANLASTADQQAYDQAFQEWGSSQMRKESGAQINKDEWKQADKRYRRVLFDEKSTVEQKQAARLLATKMMVKAAGPGWTPEDQAELDAYLDEVEGTTSAQRDWDEAVKRHGKDKVLKEFGPRPEDK